MHPSTLRATLMISLVLWLAAAPLAGQAAGITGSGHSASQARELPPFQAIQLSGAMDLQVRQGAQQSVLVQADDNLLPLLETVVQSTREGPTLLVRWQRGQSLRTKSPVKVSVVVPQLGALALAGSGDLRLEPFDTPRLKLNLAGSGDVRLDGLNTEEFSVSVSGSGDVAGSGHAARLQVSVAGSGDVKLGELSADEVKVTIAGSGDVAVNARKTLEVRIAGSGDVVYTGAATLKSQVAGSGSVRAR